MAINRSQSSPADAARRAQEALRTDRTEQTQQTGQSGDVGTPPPTGELGATFDSQTGKAHEQADSGLLNQQVGTPKPPGTFSPIFARSSFTTEDRPPRKAELSDLEAKFDALIGAVHDDPARVGELTPQLAQLIRDLDPVVEQKKGALDEVSVVVNKKEKQLNWFQRNIGLFTPKEVADLRDQRDDLKEAVTDARAFRGGARIAIRLGAEADAEQLPETWATRLQEASGQVPTTGQGPAREKPLGDLIRLQDQLVAAGDRAELAHATAKADVSDFKDEVAWHQRVGWVDWMFGGVSARGDLYRKGKEQQTDLGSVANQFSGVESQGHGMVTGHVNELLKVESGEYRSMRGRYDKLKPAWDSLNDVMGSAREAQRALRDAEQWIDRRNALQFSEPTRYETVTVKDTDGTTRREQQETQRWKSWKSDYDHAEHMARWESSTAESEVREVNAELPRLEQNLRAIGELGLRLPRVDDEISNFFGTFASFGMWSFDSSQVNDMQRQMGRLEGRLDAFHDRVGPEFTKHRDWVFDKIASRRAELRDA